MAFLLRVAAAFIATHPEQTISYDDYDGEVDGEILAQDCLDCASQEQIPCMIFEGRITQAGGEGSEPTVTITTDCKELRECPSIPFYKRSTITITPL
jgi:hypothetical protein